MIQSNLGTLTNKNGRPSPNPVPRPPSFACDSKQQSSPSLSGSQSSVKHSHCVSTATLPPFQPAATLLLPICCQSAAANLLLPICCCCPSVVLSFQHSRAPIDASSLQSVDHSAARPPVVTRSATPPPRLDEQHAPTQTLTRQGRPKLCPAGVMFGPPWTEAIEKRRIFAGTPVWR